MSAPKYMKDAAGFCYTYTETLATQKHLSPYDGDVDAGGFATDQAPAKPVKGAKPAKPTKDTAPVEADPLDAALAAAQLDD